MRITRLRLENFGAFRDWPLDRLQPGLNLLFGPNESGKTTLMCFLRAMLFGFLRRGATPYDPVDGSEPGGTLQLTDSRGATWVVERRGRGRKGGVTVSGPSGAAQGEDAVRRLLDNLTREVFENIFAFGLKELSDIATLKQREVQHLLYSASMGLGGVSLKAVEDDLERQSGALFTPRGSTREVNQILARLGDLRTAIRDLEHQPQEYRDLKARLTAIEAEIEALSRDREGAARASRWLEKLLQAWETWQGLSRSRLELQGLPEVAAFPADGLNRWEALKKNLEEVEGELEHWEGRLGKLRQEQVGPVNEVLLNAAPAVQDLWDERVLFREKTQELKQLEAAAATAGARLAESLASLGPAWDEARLDGFQPSLAWQSALNQWPRRLEEADAAVRQAEERQRGWTEKLAEREAARQQAAAAGAFRGGRIFLWSFAALGLALALAAGGVFYFLDRLDLALLLGVGGGMAWLADLVYLLQLRLTHGRRLQEFEAQAEQAATACQVAADALSQARGASAATRASWRRFLQEWSLEPESTPYEAMEVLREAGKARGYLQELREARLAVQSLEEYLVGYTHRLELVLAQLGQPLAARDDVNRLLEPLKVEVDESIMNRERQKQLAQKIEETEAQRNTWHAKVNRLLKEQRRLLELAGAGDEEAFRRLAALDQERRELDHNLTQLTAQLQLLAGNRETQEKLEADLAQSTRDELEQELGSTRQRLQDLEARLSQARQEQGKNRDRLASLERADDLGRALLEEQTEAARLRGAAHRWAVATLSRHFLEAGRRQFEAEYQPQVLKRASDYFGLLTRGRYQRVMATLEGEKFLAVNRTGGHVAVENLSRGTQEQLYLAMRFALVQEYAQNGSKAPLILDDILVNFDHRRARQAVRLLQEMGQSHQLLLFTCHPHIVALVQEVLGPEAPEPMVLKETDTGEPSA